MLQGNEIRDRFLAECSEVHIAAITDTIKNAYASARQFVAQNFREEVQPQAWGYERWLKIDSELLDMAETQRIEVRWCDNTKQTHIGHTELHYPSFFLTALRTSTKDARPNAACYRANFAKSNQGVLFEGSSHTNENKIWVAIQHVPDTTMAMPSSIRAVFYDSDYNHACDAIDLLAVASAYKARTDRREVKPQIVVALKNG